LSIESLTDIFISNSDEPYSKAIAHAIFQARNSISTTNQLTNVIRDVLSVTKPRITAEEIKKSQQRVFQALRIFVNDEFAVLDQFLSLLPTCLKPQGRVAILTFHSGEDRRVKKSFLHGFRTGIYKQIAREPIRPSPQERRANPRSSCAKLRWAERA
jgi:16S rRNA (cytosine1402-N4)-methyltransferase